MAKTYRVIIEDDKRAMRKAERNFVGRSSRKSDNRRAIAESMIGN